MFPRAKQSSIALAILIVSGALFVIGSRAGAEPETAESEKMALVTVPTIKETGTASSTFATDAFVVGKYECLACPAGADCRICPARDSAIVIDSAGPSSPETPLLSTQMIVYTDAGKYLHLGQRYRFKLYLEPKTTASSSAEVLRAKVIGYIGIGI